MHETKRELEIMNIAQLRAQLELANTFAKMRIDFVVVPITSDAEQVELAERALRNIDILQGQQEAAGLKVKS